MSFNKREFEQLPDWLQECWNLSPAIARKAEKYIDSIKPLSSDAVLAEVRAIITAIDVYQNNLKMSDFEKLSRQTRDDLNNIVEMKIKLSEHFS